MKSQIYYQLETDDQDFAKRLGEDLNMISFVFTHNPELKPVRREVREGKKAKKPKDYFNPHSKIFNAGPFTLEQLHEWSQWVDKIIDAGYKSIERQHPAYRDDHTMALRRFREDTYAFLDLFGGVFKVRRLQ